MKKKKKNYVDIKSVWDGGKNGLMVRKKGKASKVKDAGGRWGLRKIK